MVLVPKILVQGGAPKRESEREFPFHGLEFWCDFEDPDAADRPVASHHTEVSFLDRDVAKVHRPDFVEMPVQLEGRVLQFRSEVNREADPRSLNLQEIPPVVVPDASRPFRRRSLNRLPVVVAGMDPENSGWRPHFSLFTEEADFGNDDHGVANLRRV